MEVAANTEMSDFDYALSLHIMMNGENPIHELVVEEEMQRSLLVQEEENANFDLIAVS